MAIIADNMARSQGKDLTAESVEAQMKIPPQLQEAYTRVVIAGMKVMFSKNSHKLMLDQLKQPGPVGLRLGKGIAGLLLILFKESKQTMPPQVIIPAGVKLLMEAADFLRKSKLEKVTNKDIGEGTEEMIRTVLEKFGVTPDKIEQMLGQFDNAKVDAAAQQMGGGAA